MVDGLVWLVGFDFGVGAWFGYLGFLYCLVLFMLLVGFSLC